MDPMISLANQTETIKVVVGGNPARSEKPVTWVVHKAPFLEFCGHARKTLSRPFKDENEDGQVIHFPQEEPSIFDVFIKYVYTRSV